MNTNTLQDFITPQEVCELVPGMTRAKLAQLRLVSGKGPTFYKPTDRTVIYRRSEVLAWVLESAKSGTAEANKR